LPRRCQVFFQIHGVIAERRFGFRARGRERDRQVRRGVGDLHAAAAAACRRLHQHRKADVARGRERILVRFDSAVGAGDHRDAELLRGALRFDLVAHQPDVLRLGSNEVYAVLGQDLGKAGILGQETVARMDRVCARDLARREERGDVEIGVFRSGRTDAHAFIGEAHVHGVSVGGRVHGHGLDAEFLASAQYPQCDLAAVGDQDFLEHR
jgi:hypothetical protein